MTELRILLLIIKLFRPGDELRLVNEKKTVFGSRTRRFKVRRSTAAVSQPPLFFFKLQNGRETDIKRTCAHRRHAVKLKT